MTGRLPGQSLSLGTSERAARCTPTWLLLPSLSVSPCGRLPSEHGQQGGTCLSTLSALGHRPGRRPGLTVPPARHRGALPAVARCREPPPVLSVPSHDTLRSRVLASRPPSISPSVLSPFRPGTRSPHLRSAKRRGRGPFPLLTCNFIAGETFLREHSTPRIVSTSGTGIGTLLTPGLLRPPSRSLGNVSRSGSWPWDSGTSSSSLPHWPMPPFHGHEATRSE